MGTGVMISSQGQITLPKRVREDMGIKGRTAVSYKYNPKLKTFTVESPEPMYKIRERAMSYVKPGTKPLLNVREFIENSDWGQQ